MASVSYNIKQLQRVCTQISRGEHELALESIEALLQRTPDSWSLFHLAGLCCFGLGHFRDALGFFEEAQKVEPERYPTLVAISSCYVRLGRLADGLFYHKLSLTQPPEYDTNLLIPMIDFRLNLALWREDSGLISGILAEQDGLYIEAQKRVDDYAKVKDASASVLNRLIRLCLRLGLYEEALDWSVVFHRSFPQDARSRLLAAETLTFFDDRDALKAQIQECLEAEDCRIQAGALGLIAKWQLDSLEDQAVFIEQWWRDIPECPYDLDSFLRTGAEDSSSTLSVGVFLGDLCVHSPAQWFLNAFPCFHHTSTQFTIYIDGADHWGREYFRSYRYDVVETDEIDTETLCCIMVRNGHQTILDLSNFSQHSRLDALVHMSGRRRVGLVNHTAHLAQKDRLGFDAVIVSDEDVQSSATCHALRDLAFIPPALVQQWSPREAEDFVIVLALLPNQVSSVLPSIVALLQLDERIRLSIDQTLCGERGLNILAAGLRRHNVADYEERVVLFSQSDFRHLDEIGEHLCTGDVYLSFGMTGYDFVALERRVPIVIAPEVQLSYGGHSRAVLENFDLPMMHPVDSPTFIGTIKNWLSHPDAWSDWYTEYQRQCQNLSEPAHHFERILKVQNLMFPKNS